MILKQKDDIGPHLAELERLLKLPGLAKQQWDRIEEEMWMIRAGAKGEKEAAYHIDFGWKDGENSVVIHDLRLEHNGRVAQIDHLILNRRLDGHVIESKAFGTHVQISASGEWEVKTRFGWKGMPSPVEQNRRHIEVLESLIRNHQLAPKRFGLTMPIRFHNWVLVSPECKIQRQGNEWEQVVKMDLFETKLQKRIDEESVIDTLAAASKLVSLETIEELARKLIAAHKPATFNFAAKFGISEAALNDDTRFAPPDDGQRFAPSELDAVNCAICSTVLDQKVIDYCRKHSTKFKGEILCRDCQKVPTLPTCDGCGLQVDQKVINFCRFNSKRFGGKKLCRECQVSAAPLTI